MLTDSSTQNIMHAFIQLGLTDEHAMIYISTLELGSAPASKIAKRAKVPRTTTYDLLDQLIDWGLISKIESHNKTYFSAEDPNNLLSQIKYKRNRVTDIAHTLDKDMYQLEGLFAQNRPNMPKVRFFQGERGMQTVLYNSLSAGELLSVCGGDPDRQTGLDEEPDYLMDFVAEANIRGLKSREILIETPSAKEYVEDQRGNENCKIIVIPQPPNNRSGHVDKHIYDNKIAYVSHDNMVGVIIEDNMLFEHERMLFETLWEVYGEKYGIIN